MACPPASTIPLAATPTPMSSSASPRRPPDWVASITPTCATPSAIGFWTRLKRRWRSAKEGALPCHLTHFYQRITHPGSARQLLDLVEGSVDGGQDVTMDCYPIRVQQHPGVDPDSPVGPQRRPEKAERGPAFRGRARAPAGRGPCSGHRVMERPLADLLQASPQSEV